MGTVHPLHRATARIPVAVRAKSRTVTGSPWSAKPYIAPERIVRTVDIRPTRHIVVGLDDGLDGARLLVVALAGLTLAVGAFMAGVL